VENAVKHSLDPNGDPLRIYITTRQTEAGSEIIVENNGVDYRPADDNEPHIALSNIRQRLEMMCKGEMTIMPREGGGTVVKVIIPHIAPASKAAGSSFFHFSSKKDRLLLTDLFYHLFLSQSSIFCKHFIRRNFAAKTA